MNRSWLVLALTIAACNGGGLHGADGPIVAGAYSLTTTIDSEDCTPAVHAPAITKLAILRRPGGALELFLPGLSPGEPFLRYEGFSVPPGAVSATRATRACNADSSERVEIIAHDDRTVDAQVMLSFTPATLPAPCVQQPLTSACGATASLHYQLELECDLPCRLMLATTIDPAGPGFICDCTPAPSDGGTD